MDIYFSHEVQYTRKPGTHYALYHEPKSPSLGHGSNSNFPSWMKAVQMFRHPQAPLRCTIMKALALSVDNRVSLTNKSSETVQVQSFCNIWHFSSGCRFRNARWRAIIAEVRDVFTISDTNHFGQSADR